MHNNLPGSSGTKKIREKTSSDNLPGLKYEHVQIRPFGASGPRELENRAIATEGSIF